MKIIKSLLNRPDCMLDKDYQLLTAKKEDYPAIRTLVNQTMSEFGVSQNQEPINCPHDIADIESFYEAGLFGIIKVQDEVIGSFGLIETGEQEVELRRMYLNPQWRGKGIGNRLLKFLIMHLRKDNYKRIKLETASSMVGAQHLYKKFNFLESDNANKTSSCDKAFTLELI